MMNLFLVYQFLKRLAKPFKKWEAYKLGIIDERGNILKSRKDLNTVKERNAFGVYDLMVLNLKKLIEKLPGGKTQIASYAAALYLLREWNHFTDDSILTESVTDEKIQESANEFAKLLASIFMEDTPIIPESETPVKQKMNEEVPINNVGSGNIAGLGIGPDGEPGLTKAQQIKYIARNQRKKKKKTIQKDI